MLITVALLLIVIGGVGSIFAYRMSASAETIITEEVNGQNISSIELDVENEQVEVIPTDDDTIRIELEENQNQSNVQLTVEEDVDTLKIATSDKNFKLFSFEFFNWNRDLKIYVPVKNYHSLHIEIGNGSIQMSDLSVNQLYVNTSNGKIDLADLETEQSEIGTNNGKIKLKNVITETIQVSAHNGKIEMEQISGEVTGETKNGAISFITDDLDRPIDLQSHNGSIRVETDNKPTNVTFNTKAHNGEITIFNNSDTSNIIGNGENLINLSTHNGSITVSK